MQCLRDIRANYKNFAVYGRGIITFSFDNTVPKLVFSFGFLSASTGKKSVACNYLGLYYK